MPGPKPKTYQENLDIALARAAEYAEDLSLATIEDWYNTANLGDLIRKISRSRLSKLDLSIYCLISQLLSGKEVLPWRFQCKLPNGYWRYRANRIAYMHWLKKQLGIESEFEMTAITGEVLKSNFGGGLLHVKLINELLIEAFPALRLEGSRKTGRLKRTPKEAQSIALARLKAYADANSLKCIEDFYQKLGLGQLHNIVGSSLMKSCELDTIALLKLYFDTKEIYPWMFRMSPMGLWLKSENRVAYMHWLYETLNLKSIDDWYSVTREKLAMHKGAGLLQSWKLSELICEAYPDFQYDISKQKKANQGITKEYDYQRKFALNALALNGIELTRENLISLEADTIRAIKGGAAILKNYATFPEFIIAVFPELELQRHDFDRKGRGYWQDSTNYRPAVTSMLEKLGINEKDDFYLLRSSDFEIHGLYGVLNAYEGSYIKALVSLFPELELSPERFNRVSALQERLYALCKAYFVDHQIEWNYKHPELRFERTGRPMEIDIFIPDLLVGFELHGKQHREPVSHWGGNEAFQQITYRDAQKRKAIADYGITLIEIHDNEWDGDVIGFLSYIDKYPEISNWHSAEDIIGRVAYELRDSQGEQPGSRSNPLVSNKPPSIKPLTVTQILRLCDEYYQFHGNWPKRSTAEHADIDGVLTWQMINNWLVSGCVDGCSEASLAELLRVHRGVGHHLALPRLSYKEILAWADEYYQVNGIWPTHKSGQITGTNGETWSKIRKAIVNSGRGLPSGKYTSLADLLKKERGVEPRLLGVNSAFTC